MYNREEIKSELNRIMDELGWLEETEEGKRINFGELDSIQIISAIVEIEECFDIEIPDEYLVAEFFEDDSHIVDIIVELMENDEVCSVAAKAEDKGKENL